MRALVLGLGVWDSGGSGFGVCVAAWLGLIAGL